MQVICGRCILLRHAAGQRTDQSGRLMCAALCISRPAQLLLARLSANDTARLCKGVCCEHGCLHWLATALLGWLPMLQFRGQRDVESRTHITMIH